jgi:hypothetical protein
MKKPIWWFILVIALGGPVILYLWLESEKPPPQELPRPMPPAAEPAIRHPIDAARPTDGPPEPAAKPLPPLAESDGPIRDALARLLGHKLEEVFYLQDIIRRFVATVDNLPRENVSPRLMPVKPVAGRLVTASKGESLTLSPENGTRYGPYVRLAEAAPTTALVAMYVQFYPLFQQQYEQLGYPGKYFNDRLVQVIDHLLAAPQVQGPVLLTQPKVLYEFADPKLEGLSVGQKILVRMGGENAAKMKAKLREIRAALVSKAKE